MLGSQEVRVITCDCDYLIWSRLGHQRKPGKIWRIGLPHDSRQVIAPMWAAIWVTTTLDLTNQPTRTDTLRCHHRYGMSHLVKSFTVNFCIANRLFLIMPPHHRYNKRMLGWCNAHHRVDGLPTLVLRIWGMVEICRIILGNFFRQAFAI